MALWVWNHPSSATHKATPLVAPGFSANVPSVEFSLTPLCRSDSSLNRDGTGVEYPQEEPMQGGVKEEMGTGLRGPQVTVMVTTCTLLETKPVLGF